MGICFSLTQLFLCNLAFHAHAHIVRSLKMQLLENIQNTVFCFVSFFWLVLFVFDVIFCATFVRENLLSQSR